MKQKKYFITYGSQSFSLQKKHLTHLANSIDYFDHVVGFGPDDLSIDFKNKYKHYLDIYKGGGYWIWKCEILRMILNEIKEGDLVVYSSAGSSFNPNGKAKLEDYVNKLNESNKLSLRFSLENHPEKNWTTKEIFEYFDLSVESQIANSNQLIANHFIVKKNNDAVSLFNEFNELLEEDSSLITFKYDKKNQIPTFIENRNDQSIFSVLNKIYGAYIIPTDETYYPIGDENQYNYPFLSVRKRNYSNYQRIKFYLNYFNNINKPIYFERNPDIIERIFYKLFKK
tara:strand:+ start:303 stop:1154 length:852 start_codon:yes stop_codon:yes gene_type:complete